MAKRNHANLDASLRARLDAVGPLVELAEERRVPKRLIQDLGLQPGPNLAGEAQRELFALALEIEALTLYRVDLGDDAFSCVATGSGEIERINYHRAGQKHQLDGEALKRAKRFICQLIPGLS